jgi:hypothetical protein
MRNLRDFAIGIGLVTAMSGCGDIDNNFTEDDAGMDVAFDVEGGIPEIPDREIELQEPGTMAERGVGFDEAVYEKADLVRQAVGNASLVNDEQKPAPPTRIDDLIVE